MVLTLQDIIPWYCEQTFVLPENHAYIEIVETRNAKREKGEADEALWW
jgi:hypothetical protein